MHADDEHILLGAPLLMDDFELLEAQVEPVVVHIVGGAAAAPLVGPLVGGVAAAAPGPRDDEPGEQLALPAPLEAPGAVRLHFVQRGAELMQNARAARAKNVAARRAAKLQAMLEQKSAALDSALTYFGSTIFAL